MSTNHYFEAIGMWPRAGRALWRAYAIGFILSLALTFGAYYIAQHHLFSVEIAIPVLLMLACVQFAVQVIHFLHVSAEPASRERLIALLCTGAIVLILVIGSMWIMTTLDTRMNTDSKGAETYMSNEQGI